MAFLKVENIAIKGIASAVPRQVRKTIDYPYFSEHDRKTFITGTGVEERREVSNGVCASDLCLAAAEKLLSDTKIDKQAIKALIFVSQSPDYFLPATGVILQDRLGLPKSCLSFDVGLGCSGYVYGLSILAGLLQNMENGYALLLAGDISTFSQNPRDKSAYPLFGDAGSATLLKKDTTAKPMFFNLQSDGSGYESIIIRGGGTRIPFHPLSRQEKEYEGGIWRHELNLEMDGMAVFNFALKEVKPNVQTLMEYADITLEEIDYLIMHQANLFMNETVRKKLKIAREKTPYSIQKYGNTSSASIPLTIVTELHKQFKNHPAKIVLSGFGVGLSWGSVYLQTAPFVISDLVEVE